MLFIGYTNFSVLRPGFGGWQESLIRGKDETKEYAEKLFSPERLDARCEIFLNLSLPQLADSYQQVIKDSEGKAKLEHIVYYSEELPEKYKLFLRQAATQYPFIVLDELEGGVRNITHEKIAVHHFPAKEGTYASFNLDDDDILSKSFLSTLAKYVHENFVGFRVTLSRGYSAIWAADKIYDARQKKLPKINIGLASINRVVGDTLFTPPASGHDRVDEVGPLITDATRRAYLHLRHVNQDTAARLTEEQATEKLARQSLHLPKIKDQEEFFSEFPVLDTRKHQEDLIGK